jgi:hypothetical protein
VTGQRGGKRSEPMAADNRLAFEVLGRSELNGHNALSTIAKRQDFIEGHVFLTTLVLDAAVWR